MAIIDEVKRVADALRSYEARIIEIVSLIAGKTSLGDYEVQRCQHLLTELKRDIKESADRGKVEDNRLPQTEWERMYFQPPLRKANAELHRLRANSHPIHSRWSLLLRDVGRDISDRLELLQRQLPGG
ncbi:hypothetical protein [Noviherbaspirillum malthae]|uniref:hypothetical protein n=1 Tax=Noviherbaspirillum malthae TaxID=1260987 RepID=UPI00188EE8C3|nr:hypothetical protein [Noviherbaspirillum malthae]